MSDEQVTETVEAPPSTRGRSAAIVAMVVIAALLTTPALVAYWAQRTINDTERYIATTGPLVESPEVQDAVATKVIEAIEKQVDVEALLTDAFSGVIAERPKVELLIGPIAGAVNGLIESRVNAFVASDAFGDLWVQVNTRTQQALVRVLEGDESGAVSIQDEGIVLDVSVVIDEVKQRLVDRGLTFVENAPVGETDRQILLLDAPELRQAQNIYAFTNPIAKWLIWVVLALYLGAIVLASRRARLTAWVGVAMVANGLLIAFLLAVGRQVFVNQLAGTVFGPASKVFYNGLLKYLERGGQSLVTLGVILVIAAWFAGSNSSGTAARSVIGNGLESVGAAVSIDQVRATGRWVGSNLTLLRWVIIALGVIIAVAENEVTPERLLWSTVFVLVLLAVAQALVGAGKAAPAPGTPPEAHAPTPA